jgi:hypothetical protein
MDKFKEIFFTLLVAAIGISSGVILMLTDDKGWIIRPF